MRTRLSMVLAGSLALAACQGDNVNPSVSTASRPVAAQENFLALVPEEGLSGGQQERLAAVRRRPGSEETRVARMAGSAGMLREGAALRLAVAPGRQVVAVGDRVEQRSANDISWGGRVEGIEESRVQLVYGDGGVVGTVTLGTEQFRIEPLGNGLHAVTRLDQTKLPPEHPADMPAGVLDVPAFEPMAARNPGDGEVGIAATSTINVLVVYTAAAAAATSNIGNLIQLAVDETNQSYVNSGISINMVRVHTAQVTYSESGKSFSQHVSSLRGTTDGVMDNVHTLRNTYAADVVVLVVNDSEACGIASTIKATATSAFAVAHYSCITGYYSFGHEVGHLQGARHDRYVDASTTPYPYGHGYIPASKSWRTVMAYGNNCGNCTRIQYWSNPLRTYGGVAMGTTTYEDNARVLNLTAPTVAAFR